MQIYFKINLKIFVAYNKNSFYLSVMKTIAQHQKDARQADKFVLVNGTTYIADRKFTNSQTTDNLEHALKFSVGYDDERMKSRAWSMSLGLNFSVMYL